MPFPPGVATVTLTGRYCHPDGTPINGTVTFAAPSLLTISGADTIATGSVMVTLVDGQFSVVLIATDNPSAQPTDWLYNVTERLQDVSSRSYAIALPQATPLVNLADIAPANPASGNYVPVIGPPGTPGKTILSGTGAPGVGVGIAGDFYIDTATWNIYGPKSGTWPAGVPLAGSGLVSAVNGMTGSVSLNAGHVGADPAGTSATAIASEVVRADAAYAAASVTGRVTTAEATIAAQQRRTIRRGGIDPSLIDAVYSGTAPTITTTQTTTSSITTPVKYAPPLVTLAGSDVRGDFLFLGATDFAIGAGAPDSSYALPTSKIPHTYASGQSSWAFEFVTDAPELELRFKYISAASMYRLSIDGRPMTLAPQSVGGTTAGSGHMLKIAFGSSVYRRIRVDMYSVPFGGIYIGTDYRLYRPVTSRGRLMVLGDSITDGSAQNAGGGTGTWLYKAARMLGVTDVWDQARGGTGYITAGSYAVFGDRLAADVTAYAPDVLIIKGGYNDNGGNQTTVGTAAAALYSAAKTALPSTQIIVVGPLAPTATPSTGIVNTDNTLAAQALAAGLPFVSLVTGETKNSTGAVISTQNPYITTANVTSYIGADSVHPTDAGHDALGRWMVRALAPVLPL
ncbi:SGNH/GDSL hydrolase family protein [Streptomyces sp. H27-H1]|uniref:SGNH/GDSL hydrolase family protein n=1 Tax=Streptomyces sp. H27-H1 TaxID=2996461 RepID=UPI0022709C54|nr:SGNH/GDSL hydrolase family protein [Streptomyces sp. H27-H1]MCY0926225.1 SGNH/GDSL hydrolase family protein [Streptomyces sp. H27-H1]